MIGIKFRVFRVCELLGTLKIEHNLTVKYNGEGQPWEAGLREAFRWCSSKCQWASPFSEISCSWGMRGETRHSVLKKGADSLPILYKPTTSPTVVYHYWSGLSFQPQELRESVAAQDEALCRLAFQYVLTNEIGGANPPARAPREHETGGGVYSELSIPHGQVTVPFSSSDPPWSLLSIGSSVVC